MNDDRFEIRFSGSGGQGIITAAKILAYGVGIFEKKHVCQTQSYGPEARGGTSKAEVVISNSAIDYPKAIKPDILLSMNQESCDKYFSNIKDEGLLVVDSNLVEQLPTNRVIAIPFVELARKKLNNSMAANMIALGVISVLSGLIKPKNIETALKKMVPSGTESLNLKGLRAGFEAIKEFDINTLPMTIALDEEYV